jgi:hypothetical protein
MKLSPVKATEIINELILEVKKVGGTFIPLWHNTTLNDEGPFKGWRDVYIKMVEEGIKN